MATQVTDAFKEAIKTYLDGAAAFDEAFAEKYTAEGKTLDECCDFIVTQVQKSGRHGFADAEIYGLAMHYYQEDEPGDITKGASSMNGIVVNHTIELSEEEKEQARQKAINDLAEVEKRKILEKEKREKEAAKKKADEAAKKAAEEGALFLF